MIEAVLQDNLLHQMLRTTEPQRKAFDRSGPASRLDQMLQTAVNETKQNETDGTETEKKQTPTKPIEPIKGRHDQEIA